MLLLVVLVAVLNSIPGLSNSVICLFAGICFGPWLGLTINWSGNILGNLVVYSLLSKLSLPAKWTHNKLLTELNHSAHKKLRLIISFMVPIIPSIIVNYACTQEKMNLKQFLPLVIIGMLPTSFLYAFGGRCHLPRQHQADRGGRRLNHCSCLLLPNHYAKQQKDGKKLREVLLCECAALMI